MQEKLGLTDEEFAKANPELCNKLIEVFGEKVDKLPAWMRKRNPAFGRTPLSTLINKPFLIEQMLYFLESDQPS